MHYQRWRKNGDPMLSLRKIPVSPTCLVCGAENPEKGPSGPQAAYCSPACRSAANWVRNRDAILSRQRDANTERRSGIIKACPHCGLEFTPSSTTKQRFCSRSCTKAAANAASRARRPICALPDCDNKSVSRGLCRKHHPSASTWSKGKPETRRANLRRKTQQRRARINGDPDAELIDRDEIGDRDAWRCGLCSNPVDRTLSWPEPMSASLDHIEPLSLGGKHARSNVQIAHLACNIAKGNRVADVQPLLVG